MNYMRALLLVGTFLGLCQVALAREEGDIKSCYDMVGVEKPAKDSDRHLFVLIDQTTLLNDKLKAAVKRGIKRNLQPGTTLTITSFSAYVGNRYSSVLLLARLDTGLAADVRSQTGKTRLKKLDTCLESQIDYANKLVDLALAQAFADSASGIPQSDVIASLQDFAEQNVVSSPAENKIVLLVSDMLENSSVSSFYGSKAVRHINPEAEFQKYKGKDLLADFGGAKVYVLGAGLLASGKGTLQAYRDPVSLRLLEEFWQKYFAASGAELVEFGKPALIQTINWNKPGANRNDIKSCFELLKLGKPRAPASRHIFVLIDETTVLDRKLKASVKENLLDNLKPGTAVTVGTFSAFLGDNYAEVLLSAQLDHALTKDQRYKIGKTALNKLDRCLGSQGSHVNRLASKSLDDAFKASSSKLPKSDVIASLYEFSRNAIKPSPASDKIVILVSDMLENSGITSFYARNTIRKIDPKKEVDKVRKAGFLTDFDNARVFVVGAGLISSATGATTKSYRDPDTMNRLEAFWSDYFTESSSNLIELGQPALLRKVK